MTGEGLNRGLGQTIEWRIILCYLCLVAIGVLSIFASGYSAEGSASLLDFSTRAGKQILWAGISLSVGCVILFVIKPFLWEVISTPAYIFVLLLLVATLVLGSEVNGSRSWFKLGPLSFQPCELSKITTSLLLAHFLRGHGFNARKMNDLATVLAVVGIPTLLILAEKETGTVLVYLGYIFVLYREGLSGWWIILFLVLAVLFILSIRFPLWVGFAVLAVLVLLYYVLFRTHVAKSFKARRQLRLTALLVALVGSLTILSTDFVFDNVLKPHQKLRIEVLLGMKEDPMGAGYNVNQSLIAIGSGGLTGKGYLQGTQTTFGFVPEQSTDFIFCTIGEEFGFVGCFILIGLFVYLIGRILKVAEGCREPFNRVYGYCIAACFFMHLIINVGMTIKLMPVIGIPLPFISYGGTSLLSFTTMLFIFLALVKQERRYF
ncbi:MAG: rod shape-determining protein RodA [Bacteroidales bacterium]|nr:rod shape-determining protein RodA [Bacteroidales bacterium]